MRPLYDTIGKKYDTTRKADQEIARRLRHHLHVPNSSKVLNIACGTGNYTAVLEATGLQMAGCDLSTEMITQAKLKSK
ncbi:methyltransferase domain-containing protein [Halalkalibacterium halodurans]|uniref:methyltransferase domain-containing protein n=1 Tax=Halalkalibacterium halodurans TaxID=86665 RepID=UPI0005A2ED03|nr:methyltransferase domain-containing protein [Halalkalibacterium halodurans]MED4125142.1 methyltransferase domain-containing protein [Halalkalibacterium halodurans]MED4172828.1 methyltransferase domain-containing protein [Halalkalibacterium halodurans]